THPEALDSADAIVMLVRFRHWDDDTNKRFEAAVNRGVPIIAMRTSTHAFSGLKGTYEKWNYNSSGGGFGKQVLGETWVSHWGRHKVEASLGVVEKGAKDHPILRGAAQIFANSDVYEAHPPADAKILVRGQVLKGMTADTPPADYRKKRSTDKEEQGVNEPMMPIAWTREVKNEAGRVNKIFTTTMGAATDLESEGTRRLIVNSVFWGLGLKVPDKANVDYIGDYKASMYSSKGHKPGVRPSDLKL
ncbi:MAG: ThuA domain-containing protein, partial [Limisphaerales bacterium]